MTVFRVVYSPGLSPLEKFSVELSDEVVGSIEDIYIATSVATTDMTEVRWYLFRKKNVGALVQHISRAFIQARTWHKPMISSFCTLKYGWVQRDGKSHFLPTKDPIVRILWMN